MPNPPVDANIGYVVKVIRIWESEHRIECFGVRYSDQAICHTSQEKINSDFSAWVPMCADGNLVLLGNNDIRYIWHTAYPNGHCPGNADYRLALYFILKNGNLGSFWEHAFVGEWRFSDLGGQLSLVEITNVYYDDNRVHIQVKTKNGGIWELYESSPSKWEGWRTLPGQAPHMVR
jgi:hypothetical protein